MKTINLKNKIKTFHDHRTNEYLGFAGTVKLYNKEMYVDTRNGVGYDKVIKTLDRYITHLAYKYNLSNLGFVFEDTKQHIIMRILEGIPKYDPNRKTTLSTFLHMRIERRIINEIRNASIDSKNPTVLKTSLYSVMCECGCKFMISTSGDEKVEDTECYWCNKTIENAKIFSINAPPESINTVFKIQSLTDEDNRITIEDVISDDSFDIPMVFGEKPKLENRTALKYDIEKWMKSEDPKVKKLVELVCFKDYSIKAAAEVVGISHTGATNKLKRLKRKKIIRDIFNR
jgi:RNA polymerase sigma factor (sigma-70 family)